jgi:hypothetical protein
MQPSLDSAEWHIVNQRRLDAIELQRRKVEELEQKGKTRELEHQARQRDLDNATKQLGLRQVERLAANELQKEERLAAIEARRVERLASIELRRGERLALIKLRRGKRLEVRRRAQQRKLDDATARRLEMQRLKEELAAVRTEKLRLDSLASEKQNRELWHSREQARVKQKRLRDDAGIRAGGGYKRTVTIQQAPDSSVKRRLVRVDGRRRR